MSTHLRHLINRCLHTLPQAVNSPNDDVCVPSHAYFDAAGAHQSQSLSAFHDRKVANQRSFQERKGANPCMAIACPIPLLPPYTTCYSDPLQPICSMPRSLFLTWQGHALVHAEVWAKLGVNANTPTFNWVMLHVYIRTGSTLSPFNNNYFGPPHETNPARSQCQHLAQWSSSAVPSSTPALVAHVHVHTRTHHSG